MAAATRIAPKGYRIDYRGELACTPGWPTRPVLCARHSEHYFCGTCQGYYGVPHDGIHESPNKHPHRGGGKDCACRPCQDYYHGTDPHTEEAMTEAAPSRWLLKHGDFGHRFRIIGKATTTMHCQECDLFWPNDGQSDYPPCPSQWSADERREWAEQPRMGTAEAEVEQLREALESIRSIADHNNDGTIFDVADRALTRRED